MISQAQSFLGEIEIRPTRADAERNPEDFYRLLDELRSPDLLPLRRIAEICGDTTLNPEPNTLPKIQNRTLSLQARLNLLHHIFEDEAVLFGKARRQMSALNDPLYFAFLNFLGTKGAIQDEARARIIGT